MLPGKQKADIFEVTDILYPTFTELLDKVNKMIQDDIDERQGVGPMNVDNVEEQEGT